MKKLFLFALFAALCCSCSKDDQIDLYTIHVPKKGTLAAVLEEKGLNAGTIVSLKIIGELNDEDFVMIRSMTNLVKIDLSEVNLPMLFERAFSENQMIKKVTLPNNLETIGDYAFSDCRSLTSIKITSTVETIGDYAFDECFSLKTVTFERDSQLKTIRDFAFHSCGSLTSIEIPEGVTTIGEEAFWHCSSLTSIKISKNVETIGEKAFSNCTSLKTVTFEQNSRIQTIKREAFDESGIVIVDMSQCKRNDITIEGYAFFDCPNLQLFKIGANIPPRCNAAFGDINLYSVLKVPSGSIDAYKAATGWTRFASITGLDE
ncbi:MAG: leucine-rich repeat domain-containing protein [Alistipes senegalensis]